MYVPQSGCYSQVWGCLGGAGQPPSALILEKQGTSLSQNIDTTKFCVVVAIGEDSFVK